MSIKWTQGQYGNWSAVIGRVGHLGVCWDMSHGGGYLASALGHQLKKKFTDQAEAKAAAEKVCRNLLTEATEQVKESE